MFFFLQILFLKKRSQPFLLIRSHSFQGRCFFLMNSDSFLRSVIDLLNPGNVRNFKCLPVSATINMRSCRKYLTWTPLYINSPAFRHTFRYCDDFYVFNEIEVFAEWHRKEDKKGNLIVFSGMEKTPKVWFTRPDYEFLAAPQRTKNGVVLKTIKLFIAFKLIF